MPGQCIDRAPANGSASRDLRRNAPNRSEAILFLTHRIPFPPNKGDKIRSYHLLRYLADRYRVFLGTFVDSAEDMEQTGALTALTAEWHVERIDPKWARLLSLRGLLRREALTLPYYRDGGLLGWVKSTVRTHGIRKAVVFSSAMAQYVDSIENLRVVADFCDVDSLKWTEYAASRPWPWSWVFRREGRLLLEFERRVARKADACVFVTASERELFARVAPECAPRLHAITNGVDTGYFKPDPMRIAPYALSEVPIVFTGAMDYWPNIDAVVWFARDVLPAIAASEPGVRFYIVGSNPAPEVRRLGEDARVVVTGKVQDVRPYLQHARVVVVPLRIARGIQNKVLEAMAMGRPVVATSACISQLSNHVRSNVFIADDAASLERAVHRVLTTPADEDMNRRVRAAVESDYSWSRNLERLGKLLDEAEEAERQTEVDSAPSAIV